MMLHHNHAVIHACKKKKSTSHHYMLVISLQNIKLSIHLDIPTVPSFPHSTLHIWY